MGLLLSILQPRPEFLDTSLVLSPELDILGEVITFSHDLLLQVLDKVIDALKLNLEVLSILGNLITLGQETLLFGDELLNQGDLGGNILLELHGVGNPVLRGH